MQRAAALSRIDRVRFNVGPKSNQLTALGNTMCDFPMNDSRGVEAASAASTHAGFNEAMGYKYTIEKCRTGFGFAALAEFAQRISDESKKMDQLNFESAGNKNSIDVFIIRLRRVYQA
jgi:hypothetical protein